MARKDISDRQVLEAYRDKWQMWRDGQTKIYPEELLHTRTGQPLKVCERAMERAFGRGLLDYGVSLRGAWLTDKGRELLGEF